MKDGFLPLTAPVPTITKVSPAHARAGATVSLTGPSNRTLTTDATGFFGAVDLPTGTYTTTISVPGFQPFARTFTVAGGAVSQPDTELDIVPFIVTNSVRSAVNNTVTITWNSVPGRSYRVEQSQTLAQWTTAASGLTASATSTSYLWTIPATWTTRGFLRVALE